MLWKVMFCMGKESLRVGTWAGRMMLERMSRWVWGQIANNFNYHLWSTVSCEQQKWVGFLVQENDRIFFFFFLKATWSRVFSSTLCQVGNEPGWEPWEVNHIGAGARGCARQAVRAWSEAMPAEMGTSIAIQQRLNESDLSIDVSPTWWQTHPWSDKL